MELRKFVYDRLLNSITYGSVIPVSSVPGKYHSFPFIDLGNISLTDMSTKDSYITRALFEISVNTYFADDNTNYDACEEISSLVTDRLIDYLSDTANFNIFSSHFVSSTERFELTETGKAIINTIVIEFFIQEQ